MSATTPESPRPEGTPEPGARPPRLIQNESTTEIPVHMLFRDDAGVAAGVGAAADVGPDGVRVPLGSAVVGSGGPRPGVTRSAGTKTAGPQTSDAQPQPYPRAVRRAEARGTGRVPARAGVRVGLRPASADDPELVEWPGRALPGSVGVLAGVVGAAGGSGSLWWSGVLPDLVARAAGLSGYVGSGLGAAQWATLAGSGVIASCGFGGLTRGQVGRAWALTLFGRYRGTVRRTGLLWVNPLLLRRRVDVRLRHWRSEPMPAVDANGVALRVVVLVVWRVKDTARAVLAVDDHQEYLRDCVEAALTRVASQRPADAPFPGTGGGRLLENVPTLRDTEAVADALTRQVAADAEPVGIEVFSVQPVRIEYAPEVAAVMQRRRIAALDALHRDTVLTSVVDSVEDTVSRLTTRGLVELDDYERKALVKDLTVAFYTGRASDGA
ncbi:SPFH domain-containing protein [Streptomyces himalayensis]|uniref:SPFH domain-containing protein n=1 Tax=Streptomyces himalayensis subsp. himalayensis TaxID=2756131 RepID=A0A7W0DS48_9ACTN|nr:SPFH domain-containing protein [Streptomyces himalayensis]MBA2949753.1 SPFH domain-containing protein [Streptomyces himalayensis subsp. himalayensis]